jgi:hypothetical protein
MEARWAKRNRDYILWVGDVSIELARNVHKESLVRSMGLRIEPVNIGKCLTLEEAQRKTVQLTHHRLTEMLDTIVNRLVAYSPSKQAVANAQTPGTTAH